MLLFSVTGFTLNHAEWIKADPKVTHWEKPINDELNNKLGNPDLKMTPEISADIKKQTGIDIKTIKPELNDGEVYFAMPGPGVDEWLSIDTATQTATYERSHRGIISVLNDLHKGRDSGPVWKLFIDIIAIAAVIFCLTGFGLLWMYSKGRRITWSIVSLGVVAPIILYLLFVHM